MLFTGDMVITYTRKETMTMPWPNILRQSTTQSLHKSFARFAFISDTVVLLLTIFKFLDTQRIHNLIEYLEELHQHHKATSDHTTLLLNCYAKLKDVEKLEKFIKSEDDLNFDLETAINMCRQGGYFEQAAYLAMKHGESELVVDILIEDSKRYPEALDFIWHLDAETVCGPRPLRARSQLTIRRRTLV
jgi:hypothetical protein